MAGAVDSLDIDSPDFLKATDTWEIQRTDNGVEKTRKEPRPTSHLLLLFLLPVAGENCQTKGMG